jgi:hypothetical protein
MVPHTKTGHFVQTAKGVYVAPDPFNALRLLNDPELQLQGEVTYLGTQHYPYPLWMEFSPYVVFGPLYDDRLEPNILAVARWLHEANERDFDAVVSRHPALIRSANAICYSFDELYPELLLIEHELTNRTYWAIGCRRDSQYSTDKPNITQEQIGQVFPLFRCGKIRMLDTNLFDTLKGQLMSSTGSTNWTAAEVQKRLTAFYSDIIVQRHFFSGKQPGYFRLLEGTGWDDWGWFDYLMFELTDDEKESLGLLERKGMMTIGLLPVDMSKYLDDNGQVPEEDIVESGEFELPPEVLSLISEPTFFGQDSSVESGDSESNLGADTDSSDGSDDTDDGSPDSLLPTT